MSIRPLSLVILFLMSACGTMKEDSSFQEEYAQWQEARIERLKSKTGWLNIAGLYWLEEGENTFGSDSSNSIIFPENAAARIGSYLLEEGIETFPASMEWKIQAEFQAFDEPMEILIPTMIGTVEKNTCPGVLRFSINGIGQELYPTGTGEKWFIIFADETNGIETYGAGRFLYTEKADIDGKTIIDFNRAYNPPCAFTPFATCPLPPRQNFLSIKIEAGEKFGGH